MQHFQLTTNMRLQSQPDFQQFLLDIGEGKTGSEVEIPLRMVAHGYSLDGLIDTIFDDSIDFSKYVILVVWNDDAQEINRKITNCMSGDVHPLQENRVFFYCGVTSSHGKSELQSRRSHVFRNITASSRGTLRKGIDW